MKRILACLFLLFPSLAFGVPVEVSISALVPDQLYDSTTNFWPPNVVILYDGSNQALALIMTDAISGYNAPSPVNRTMTFELDEHKSYSYQVVTGTGDNGDLSYTLSSDPNPRVLTVSDSIWKSMTITVPNGYYFHILGDCPSDKAPVFVIRPVDEPTPPSIPLGNVQFGDDLSVHDVKFGLGVESTGRNLDAVRWTSVESIISSTPSNVCAKGNITFPYASEELELKAVSSTVEQIRTRSCLVIMTFDAANQYFTLLYYKNADVQQSFGNAGQSAYDLTSSNVLPFRSIRAARDTSGILRVWEQWGSGQVIVHELSHPTSQQGVTEPGAAVTWSSGPVSTIGTPLSSDTVMQRIAQISSPSSTSDTYTISGHRYYFRDGTTSTADFEYMPQTVVNATSTSVRRRWPASSSAYTDSTFDVTVATTGTVTTVTGVGGSVTSTKVDRNGLTIEQKAPFQNVIDGVITTTTYADSYHTVINGFTVTNDAARSFYLPAHVQKQAKAGVNDTARTISDQYYLYSYSTASNSAKLLQITQREYTEAGAYLDTVSGIFDYAQTEESFIIYRGMPLWNVSPDGGMTQYAYFRGSLTSGTGVPTYSTTSGGNAWITISYRGSSISGSVDGSSAGLYTVDSTYARPSLYLIPNVSTKNVTVHEDFRTFTEVWVYTGSNSFERVSWSYTETDPSGALVLSKDSSGASSTGVVQNGQLVSQTDATGLQRGFAYDGLGRLSKSAEPSPNGNGGYLIQKYSYDAAGHVIGTTSFHGGTIDSEPSSSAETLTTTATYDHSGYQTGSTASCGSTKTFSHNVAGGHLQETVTDGANTTTTTCYFDGSVYTVADLIATGSTTSTSIDSNGFLVVRTDGPAISGVNAWKTETRDWAGRTRSTSVPAIGGTSLVTTYNYFTSANTFNSGKLKKAILPDQGDIVYDYSRMGQRTRTVQNLDPNTSDDSFNSVPSTSGAYQFLITYNNYYKEVVDGTTVWWAESSTQTYPTDGSSDAVYLGRTRSKIAGFATNVAAEQQTWGSHQSVGTIKTTAKTVVNTTAHTLQTQTHTPDMSSSNYSSVTTKGGREIEKKGSWGETVSTSYDTLGRVMSVSSNIAGSTYYSYDSGTTRTYRAALPGGATQTYDYVDCGNNLISKVTTSYTDGVTKSAFVRYEYNKRGQRTYVWGSGTNPEYNEYDTYGRRTKLHTYQSALSAWDADAIPSAFSQPGNVTTWAYDNATGLMLSKTDAANAVVRYTYDSSNRLHTIQNARSSSASVTFGYDAKSGQLILRDYADSTPDVSFTYDRIGRAKSVTDATGTRQFTYNGLSTANPLGTAYETLPSAFYGSDKRVTTRWDDIGRFDGYEAGTSSNSGHVIRADWSYDDYGRALGISVQFNGGSSNAYTYGYRANSCQTASVTRGSLARNYAYDTLGRLNQAGAQYNASPVQTLTSNAYTLNALGQYKTVVRTGQEFSGYSGTISGSYGYNDRGELVQTTSVGGDSSNLTDRKRVYNYDRGGNRVTTADGEDVNGTSGGNYTWAANNLNEYTSTPTLPKASVSGFSDPGVLTLWDYDDNPGWKTTTRSGNYFWLPFGTNTPGKDNTYGHVRWFWAVDAYLGYYYPGDPQQPQYDADGNMLWDGAVHSGSYDIGCTLEYRYNADNQLAGLRNRDYDVTFTYDYMGRRVEEKVVRRTDTVTVQDRRYAYHGWHTVARYTVASSTVTNDAGYAWGLDDSGSYGGAGGIGGLLMWKDGQGTYEPLYDGLGNVQAVWDTTNNHIVSEYEYDPYGNLVRSTGYTLTSGTWKQVSGDPIDNPYRYQTKWSMDASLAPVTETDMYAGYQQFDIYDYGMRWYHPRYGRFINRDPIGESGGTNLNAFVGNNPVGRYDVLGMGGFHGEICQGTWGGGHYCTPVYDNDPWSSVSIGSNPNPGGGSSSPNSYDSHGEPIYLLPTFTVNTESDPFTSGSYPDYGNEPFINTMPYWGNPAVPYLSQGGGGGVNTPTGKPWDKEKCANTAAYLSKLSSNINDTINSLSDINKVYHDAYVNAWVSLSETAFMGVYSIARLGVDLSMNAAKSTVQSYSGGWGRGFLAAAVVKPSGGIAGVGTNSFYQTMQQAQLQRNAGAIIVGTQEATSELSQTGVSDMFDYADKFVDPFGNLARTELSTADGMVNNTMSTLHVLQKSYSSFKSAYDKNCK